MSDLPPSSPPDSSDLSADVPDSEAERAPDATVDDRLGSPNLASSEPVKDLAGQAFALGEPVSPVGDRIVVALRQAALLGVALLIGGAVTERIRPLEGSDRGIASTPFLWAIVLWLAVLLFHAITFDRSEIRTLEGTPLYGAVGIAALLFVIGVVSLNDGDVGRRIMYVFANAVGAVMFWWAVFSLGYLITRRMTRS